MSKRVCPICRKNEVINSICNECRKWKEQRVRCNLCPCDVCYETEQYKKAVMRLAS